jgi:predicted RNase H-like HicB family nuclease
LKSYIALIHKDPDSDYGVSFPDLPGCVTAGRDLDEAKAFAEEVLSLHVAGLVDDGEAVPEPSSLEIVMADKSNRDAVAVLVAAKGLAARAVRVNITVPDDMLARIDAYAEQHGMTRSGFLVHAAKREMEKA